MTDTFSAPVMNITWASYFVAAVVTYYTALWLISLVRARGDAAAPDFKAMIVLLVPARNEELVIDRTIELLRELDYPDYLMVLLNDGSTDNTSLLAHRHADEDQRVIVIDRGSEVAGCGKSDVLNHGFRTVSRMLADGDPRLKGRTADEILIGIVDADGSLDPHTLRAVAPYFSDPKVGQLQIGVKIANAADNVLARMQDMEFVGFSCLVQVARDRIGSSGLGGNGQFTRLSALQDLGRAPWTHSALTEDLDLGLSLVERGWVTRFSNKAFVHQQGLTSWRPLLRQRTRWIQGHYQCWSHIPKLLTARHGRLAARLDLIAYLLLVVTVVVVSFTALVGVFGALGLVEASNSFLMGVPDGAPRMAASAFFTLAPIVAFTITYQRFSAYPFRWWEVPTFSFLFTIYSYIWITVTFRAWGRMLLRRNNWAKTPRVTDGALLGGASRG